MKRILLLLLFTLSLSVYAQHSAQIELAPILYFNAQLDSICDAGEKPERILDTLKGAEKKEVKNLYEGRAEFLRSLMETGYFIYESPILDYIKEIQHKMAVANPGIGSDFMIILSRSDDINAYSIGNKVLVVNLGLINQVNSTDELAFIIAHEMAHDLQRHGDEKILSYARTVTDKERKEEIKKIMKSKYRVYSKLKEYFIPGLMAQMQFSRMKEFEADSIGMHYALNAGFTLKGGIDCLNVLNHSSDSLYEGSFDWTAYLTQHNCQIHPYWDNSSQSSLGSFEIEEPEYLDRLKTHPDCADRIVALKKFKPATDSLSVDQLRKGFRAIKELAKYELVASGIASDNYSSSLYHGIQHLKLQPSDMFMRGLVIYLYADLAYLKKLWKAGTVLSIPDPQYHPADYFDFLSVIWEMSMEETTCIASDQWAAYKDQIPEGTNLAIEALISYAQDEKDRADISASEYLEKYPEGRYALKMEDLLNRQ